MPRIMLKEWRDALPFAALYLFACLLAGRVVAPLVPALDAARPMVSALLALAFAALAAARPFAGERAHGTLEFTAALPVGRAALFAGKAGAALLLALAGSALVAASVGAGPRDIAAALQTSAAVLGASFLLLFAAVLSATVAGLGEFAALGLGALAWLLFADLALGLRTSGLYNPIHANLLPALGLLAAALHLFARGEPFDGSRRERDLGRALLVLLATVAGLHLLAAVASPPATEADLAARALHGRSDEAGVRTGPVAGFDRDGRIAVRTRVPWWDPYRGDAGFARREGWIDLASREVRLAPDRGVCIVTPSPGRKRCAWVESRGETVDGARGPALVAYDDATGRSTAIRPEKAHEFRADRIEAIAWRPDETRLLAVERRDGGGVRLLVADPATGRMTALHEAAHVRSPRYLWGAEPDAVAVASYDFDAESRARIRGFTTFRQGDAGFPFTGSSETGTVECLAVAGEWLLAVTRDGDARHLHARAIGRAEERLHRLPDAFDRPLATEWDLPFLRYDPAGVLRGLSGANRGGERFRLPQGLALWRLDLSSGSADVTLAEPAGKFEIVHDAAGLPRLVGVVDEDDELSELTTTRWYRFDPESFTLSPANFTRSERRTSVTRWPRWMRHATILGDAAWLADDRAATLLSFPLPPAGVSCGFEETTALLPCPHCGR